MRLARTMPLAEAVFPRDTLLRNVLLVVAFSLLTAVLTRVEIPLWPVPITGQTFAVLLAGAALGSRKGALSQLLYLATGVAGAPVFSGGGAGPQQFAGPTGGYLIGFVAAAFVVGLLAERGWDRSVLMTAAAMVVGNLVIYAFGLARLAGLLPLDRLFAAGLFPFLIGDAIKIVLASLLLPGSWWLIGQNGHLPR